MALSAAVEVEPAVLRVVPEVHRHTVGIAVVSQDAQDAAGLASEDPAAFLIGKLLANSKHGAKHRFPPPFDQLF